MEWHLQHRTYSLRPNSLRSHGTKLICEGLTRYARMATVSLYICVARYARKTFFEGCWRTRQPFGRRVAKPQNEVWESSVDSFLVIMMAKLGLYMLYIGLVKISLWLVSMSCTHTQSPSHIDLVMSCAQLMTRSIWLGDWVWVQLILTSHNDILTRPIYNIYKPSLAIIMTRKESTLDSQTSFWGLATRRPNGCRVRQHPSKKVLRA